MARSRSGVFETCVLSVSLNEGGRTLKLRSVYVVRCVIFV